MGHPALLIPFLFAFVGRIFAGISRCHFNRVKLRIPQLNVHEDARYSRSRPSLPSIDKEVEKPLFYRQ